MTPAEAVPGEPEISVLRDSGGASSLAARRIAEALRASVEARGVAHWVTTGGSTPSPIYRSLLEAPLRAIVPWERLHLWWTDDRWAPAVGPLSNARAARELLLPSVPVPAAQVHAIPVGEALESGHDAAWAAARYADALRAAAIPRDPAGFPILDVILVGIGGDGHLLSVFPGSSTWGDPAWVQAVPAPTHIEPHVARVTLHPRILDAARLLVVVAHGASKAAIVGRVFGPWTDPRRLPAQLARRTGAVWIVDEAAAATLPANLGRASTA